MDFSEIDFLVYMLRLVKIFFSLNLGNARLYLNNYC